MAEKHEKDAKVSSHLSIESIRVIAESMGISGLPDDAATYVAEDCTYRLKQIIQEGVKFMQHGKRRKLNTADFDHALRAQNIEPLYGFHTPDLVPFRHAVGGGREVHFTEDKELDLQDVINSTLPKVPLDITLKAHWLSIEGEQPAIPENPPPVTKDQQKIEILDPAVKSSTDKNVKPGKTPGEISKARLKHKAADRVKLKDLSTHELSVEQQLYYKEITEACVGSDEARRSEALQSLSTDPGLHQMLPRFSTFIFEGVKINAVQNNLALLIYLMRMVKALMDNQTLYLEKYLHEFTPAVTTCIVSKQLCMRPDVDNHWALRDFAARLMSQICKNFSTSTNNIQSRVTKTFSSAILSEKAALATQYGAVSGLGELGADVIKSFLLNKVKHLGERMHQATEGSMPNNADRISADNIKKALARYLPPVLKTMKIGNNDSVEDYNAEFGHLGYFLHTSVQKEKQTAAQQPQHPVVPPVQRPALPLPQTKPQLVIRSSAPVPGTPTTPRMPGPITVPRTPTTPSGGPQQKFVIVGSQQRPLTPVGQSMTINSGSGSTPTVVKVMPDGQQVTTQATPTGPGRKLVVMSLPQGNPPSQGAVTMSQAGHDLQVGMRSIFSDQPSQQSHISLLRPDGDT